MITMNTKNLLLLASLTLTMPLTAQTPQEDFKRDITLSGSNSVAYRGPQKQLTAAPKGYKPFYLSHYGRHGSRYMIGKQAYDVPYFSLLADRNEMVDVYSLHGVRLLHQVPYSQLQSLLKSGIYVVRGKKIIVR